MDEDINDYDKNNNATTILKQELDKWKNFSFILRKQNRKLFEKMLQSSYKYSDAINAKGKEFSIESLLISLIFDQHKMLLINAVINITNNNNKNSVKNKMGVKLGAAITPIIFTSSSIMNRNSRCNNIYTINNKRIIVVLDFR